MAPLPVTLGVPPETTRSSWSLIKFGAGLIAEVARVGVDHLGEPGVDATVPGPRSARARGVGQSLPQITLVAVMEPLQPIVDRPAADAEGLSDLLDRLAFEPEQRLGAAPLLGDGVVGGQVFQLRALPGGEYERSHRSTCDQERESDGSL